MKRQTESARPQPVPGQPDPSSAIQAAAALIALAMHESLLPVEELSGALARMAGHVGPRDGGGGDGDGVQLGREALVRDLTICVEALQFHDRLMQQLSQVRNLLASLAAETLPPVADSQSWNALVEGIRSRFTSDSHRALFNLLLPVSGISMPPSALHANEGSIELF